MLASEDASSSIQEAQLCVEAALYPRAISLFQQALENTALTNPDTIRYQLARAYFLNKDYLKAIETLKFGNRVIAHPDALFLLGAAYRQLDQSQRAIEALQQYLQSASLQFATAAHLELGIALFHVQELTAAQEQFHKVTKESPRDFVLAAIYLARIDLLQNKPTEALATLRTLQKLPDSPLTYEAAYWEGKALYQLQRYIEAAEHFKDALPEKHPEEAPWAGDTLYHLGWSYIQLGESAAFDLAQKQVYFDAAERPLQTLMEIDGDERAAIALGQYYLARATHLKEGRSYQRAEEVLSRQELLLSSEAKAEALLLRAEAAPTYLARDALYRHLTDEGLRHTSEYALGWYRRGLNDYDEGQRLKADGQRDAAHHAFERAAHAFRDAHPLLQKQDNLSLAAQALKYQALAAFQQEDYKTAMERLQLLQNTRDLLQALDAPDEAHYLFAMSALRDPQATDHAVAALTQQLKQYPTGPYAAPALHLWGSLHFQQGKDQAAEETFLQLVTLYPHASEAPEALFWAARCAERRGNDLQAKAYREQLADRYPHSPFGAEAAFALYRYPDYLQGDRVALKHLEAFPEKYPQSPFTIHAWYLLGLDYERDRKTPEGKWLRKKNLTAAIDAFQAAESTFDMLYQQGKLSTQEVGRLALVRYRAALERALVNLAIAEESQGTKRQIYLEYAEEVFGQIYHDLKEDNPVSLRSLNGADAVQQLMEESGYGLIQAAAKAGHTSTAEKVIDELLDRARQAKVTRGYFLSRAWSEKGQLAYQGNNLTLALEYFKQAEEAAKGKVLNPEQKLELWIQESLCYSSLQDYDNAILILSKVINDPAISALRIKAMYLRAEAYASQGRKELARRQFESAAKIGGEWALKAQEKLDREYYGD